MQAKWPATVTVTETMENRPGSIPGSEPTLPIREPRSSELFSLLWLTSGYQLNQQLFWADPPTPPPPVGSSFSQGLLDPSCKKFRLPLIPAYCCQTRLWSQLLPLCPLWGHWGGGVHKGQRQVHPCPWVASSLQGSIWAFMDFVCPGAGTNNRQSYHCIETFSLLCSWPIGMYICVHVKILTIVIRSIKHIDSEDRPHLSPNKDILLLTLQSRHHLSCLLTLEPDTAREKAFAEIGIGNMGRKLKFKFNKGVQANVIPVETFHKMFANVVLGSPESNISGYGKQWNSFKVKGAENILGAEVILDFNIAHV